MSRRHDPRQEDVAEIARRQADDLGMDPQEAGRYVEDAVNAAEDEDDRLEGEWHE